MLAKRFDELNEVWSAAVRFHSGPGDRHPAYRAIVQLGPAVVPLLLADLAESGRPWYSALRELTGDNPVPDSDRGKIQAVTDRWLAWGRERGLV